MLRILNWSLIAGLIIILTVQCKSKEDLDETDARKSKTGQYDKMDINPNGSSELAILMRKMHDDGLAMKEQILKGYVPENMMYQPGILTADPTDPKQVGTETYKTFAKSYLSISRQFENPDNAESKQQFNQIVNTCLTCHQEVCPGPMVRIRKLLIK
jgi:hypothetical protein